LVTKRTTFLHSKNTESYPQCTSSDSRYVEWSVVQAPLSAWSSLWRGNVLCNVRTECFNIMYVILTFVGPCIVILFQYISNKTQRYTVYSIWKLLYMFRGVPPLIIRSANNCIYSIWYLSHRYCYLPLKRQVAVTVWQMLGAVDTVVCAPDDDKINCVTLHLVGYIL
jgi:hypothetical protein